MSTAVPARRWAAVAVALGALVAPVVAAPAASATPRYAASARTHVTRSAAAALSASVAATASATVDKVTVKVTLRASATGRASAVRTAWATARRSGATKAKARAAARRAARAAATRKARAAAAAVARSRALSAARSAAQAKAAAAARVKAAAEARSLATRQTTPQPGKCTSLPKAGGGTWTCTFDEEFDGKSLDSSKWLPITTAQNGYAGGDACMVDSPDNIAVGGGVLNLTVRKTAPFTCTGPNGSFTTSYTGGQVATYGKFSQTYGRFAVRARFPATTIAGLQSTLWMWPQNNMQTGLTGEIDIAEEYSQYADRVIPYLHYDYDQGTTALASTDPPTGTNVVTNNQFLVDNVNAFHEYAVEWTPTTITIFVDGRTVLSDHLAPNGPSPFDQPFFLALTACLGVGPNAVQPGRTPLPATTQIDWVRSWK
jgi:beta-glucanase (GH16 family)